MIWLHKCIIKSKFQQSHIISIYLLVLEVDCNNASHIISQPFLIQFFACTAMINFYTRLISDIKLTIYLSISWQIDYLLSGSPVNTFEFIISPLLRSLPKITLDVKHALLMSHIISVIYILLYPWLSRSWLPGPLLPAEVYKVR